MFPAATSDVPPFSQDASDLFSSFPGHGMLPASSSQQTRSIGYPMPEGCPWQRVHNSQATSLDSEILPSPKVHQEELCPFRASHQPIAQPSFSLSEPSSCSLVVPFCNL